MAHRGRGRGRGGKATMSISAEQLGFGKGEALPPPVQQPPPKFPPLEFKAPAPSLIKMSPEFSYLLELKRDFAETVNEALSNNVQSIVEKKDIERYSDCYEKIISNKIKYEDICDWNLIPRELNISGSGKRKAKETKKNAKIAKEVDVLRRLQELEKKEGSIEHKVDEETENEVESVEDKDADENNAEDEDGEEVADEEMDDDTDYVNSYFDNGEGYFDDDGNDEDNVDDGPIY